MVFINPKISSAIVCCCSVAIGDIGTFYFFYTVLSVNSVKDASSRIFVFHLKKHYFPAGAGGGDVTRNSIIKKICILKTQK